MLRSAQMVNLVVVEEILESPKRLFVSVWTPGGQLVASGTDKQHLLQECTDALIRISNRCTESGSELAADITVIAEAMLKELRERAVRLPAFFDKSHSVLDLVIAREKVQP